MYEIELNRICNFLFCAGHIDLFRFVFVVVHFRRFDVRILTINLIV